MRAKEFHQRAEICERLAREGADLFTKEAMAELANAFRDEARMIEQEERSQSLQIGARRMS